MPHLDSTGKEILFASFLIFAWLFSCFKQCKVTTNKLGKSESTTKTFSSSEDIVKELEGLQETIKQSSVSGNRVSLKKIVRVIGREDKTTQTDITNPEEELKILSDIEETIKQSKGSLPNIKLSVTKHVRHVSTTKCNEHILFTVQGKFAVKKT